MAGDAEDAIQAVRMVAVMALVDGRIDEQKIALVQEYAAPLGIDEAYLVVLAESAAGEIAAASVCMMRKNAETFPGLNMEGFDVDRIAPFLLYRDGRGAPDLVVRYEALGELDRETFGHAFWQHFKDNRFAFPGDPNGLAEAFTTRHDSSHVLSGYSTSPAGELLVSTFIGAMHPDHPMAAHVLPALYSYHLGIAMNDTPRSEVRRGGLSVHAGRAARDAVHRRRRHDAIRLRRGSSPSSPSLARPRPASPSLAQPRCPRPASPSVAQRRPASRA